MHILGFRWYIEGEIWNRKSKIWLGCVESVKSHTDWETVELDNRMLIESKWIKNLWEIVTG